MKNKDRLVIHNILLQICSNSKIEEQFAKDIEKRTKGEISEDFFYDWLCKFNLNKVK